MNNPTATNGTRPVMDIREPIAKMRAQAEQNRRRAAELEGEAQRFWAEAQAAHGRIVEQADAQKAEAAYWENLAAEQEQRAGITALDVPVASGVSETGPMPATGEDGGEQS